MYHASCPSVCCPEFEPKSAKVNPENWHERFCLNCANYEEIGKIPVCAKDHRPGTACFSFRSKEKMLTVAV